MAMNIDNCPRCGKIFVRNYKSLCPSCLKEVEEQYERCAAYLRENRGCTMQQLSDETKVPVAQIIRFIREGRISLEDHPGMHYECEACAAPIREGHLCDACRQRLTKEFRQAAEEERTRQSMADSGQGNAYRIQDRLNSRLKR
jgi:flagellar operon protein (TIGR03826 family)